LVLFCCRGLTGIRDLRVREVFWISLRLRFDVRGRSERLFSAPFFRRESVHYLFDRFADILLAFIRCFEVVESIDGDASPEDFVAVRVERIDDDSGLFAGVFMFERDRHNGGAVTVVVGVETDGSVVGNHLFPRRDVEMEDDVEIGMGLVGFDEPFGDHFVGDRFGDALLRQRDGTGLGGR